MIEVAHAFLPLIAFSVTFHAIAGQPPSLWTMFIAGACIGWTRGVQRMKERRRTLGARRR